MSCLQMVAAPGAEDVLRHCGGLRTVLPAIGFDFRLALPPPGGAPPSGDADKKVNCQSIWTILLLMKDHWF